MNRKVDEDIKNGTFERVYLLFGEERFLLTKKKKLLINALTEGQDLNFMMQEERGVDPNAVVDFLETMPFMSPFRVVLLEDTGFFSNKMPENLLNYLSDIPETSVLIFSEQKVDKRSSAYKTVAKCGAAVEYVPETEQTLQTWILSILKTEGKKIRERTLAALLERTGRSMQRIRSELDKLLAYTEGREEITLADLDALSSPMLTDNVFEMVNAFAAKDENKTFTLYYELLENRTEPLMILSVLTKQFRRLLVIRTMYDAGRGVSSIATELGQKEWAVKKNLSQAKQFSAEALRRSYEDGVHTDWLIKSGQSDKDSAVALFLAAHCR